MSFAPLKLEIKSPVSVISCSRGRCAVVCALLLPGTARRACYLCNTCDLPQEIHPVMTTDDVRVCGIEMHP